MNRLRSQKFKPNDDPITPTNNNKTNNNNNSSNDSSGLLTRITKRYSTLSNKIVKRHQSGCKSSSPQKISWGSYDMTGTNSEEHRLEIGAPVLISTTTIDTDRFDVSEARLKQIGGGIAGSSTLLRTTASPIIISTAQSSPHIPSSGSENEVFVDALCNTPRGEEEEEEEQDEDISFELAVQTPKSSKLHEQFAHQSASTTNIITTSTTSSQKREVTHILPLSVHQMSNYYYETPKIQPRSKQKLSRTQHSKSAQNLSRSELKVFLQKAPSSMELDMRLTTADLEHCRDLPILPELYGASKCSLAPTVNLDDVDAEANKENSSPPAVIAMSSPLQLSKSAPNTPMCPLDEKVSGYLAQQQQFKSIDSLNVHTSVIAKRRKSVVFSSSSSINQQGSDSKTSIAADNSSIDDFDLKSVSFQSLNAQNLFLSIEELNEITRQINESEDFNRELDLEYCMHRDNLKPSERRITLLKNKNSRKINFNHNKEKLKKSWTGVKHWLGEESSKLKEAVHKQAALQRVGAASRLNLSHSDCRISPSVHGSVLLKNGSPAVAPEEVVDESEAKGSEAIGVDKLGVSCSSIAAAEEPAPDDLESSFTHQQADDTSPASKRSKREGQNGFEELRRYIKQGGDFGKELILILQERVESELIYSKSLSKMANKLNKACRELPGSIADAWRGVATEMESRSDIHRQLSASLTDEIVKPLKIIVDTHHKTRKTVESNVDKSARVLSEWRISEAKAKKASHTAARDNEKLQDAMLDVRIQKSPSIALLHQGPNKVAAEKEMKSAEKDCAKLDSKRKKAEEAVKRADVEYYTLCVRAERARVDWEMSVLRGSSLLQTVESQRLSNMKNFVTNYVRLTSNMNPILDGLVHRLQPQIEACNVVKDMQVVKNIRRISEGPSEQLLPDFYCEHTTLAMNRERRKHALVKLLQLVKTDLERERRSRNGIKGLSQSLNNQEHQNITDKLYHIRSMLTYLEGARFKLHSALLELDHKPRSSHPLAQHIQITRDRTGLQQSILKVPLWLKNNDKVCPPGVNGEDPMHDNEYEYISQPNNSTNVSCADLNRDVLIKPFNRSKSNIETFTNNAQICLSTTSNKAKTIAANNETDPFYDRGQADGGSNQHDSDFDEFSSQDDDDDERPMSNATGRKTIIEKSSSNSVLLQKQNGHLYQNSSDATHNDQTDHNRSSSNNSSPHNGSSVTVVLSRCKALYSYTPKLYDELELSPGDIIEVHAKQEDGWWLGALRNQVGIFPATYVEEFA